MRPLRAIPLSCARPVLLGALLALLLAPPRGCAGRAWSSAVIPVDAADSPWVVALASRDRFGATRSGQFCGGVLVGVRR